MEEAMNTIEKEPFNFGITQVEKRSHRRSIRKRKTHIKKKANQKKINTRSHKKEIDSTPFALVGFFNTITNSLVDPPVKDFV